MRLPRPSQKTAPAPCLVFAALFMLVAATVAGAQVTSSETTLAFNTLASEPQYRTFTVQGSPLPKLTYLRHDLVNKQTGAVLPANNLSVTSERDDNANRETFTVTVNGASSKSGDYEGALDLLDAEKPGGAALLKVDIKVKLRGVPSVEPEVNSKALNLRLTQPWGDLPFSGTPTPPAAKPCGDAGGLPEHTVYLVENADYPAKVEGAGILTLKSTDEGNLPDGVVRVSSCIPLDVTSVKPAAVKVTAGGDNLPAGEYNGSLQIKVADQKQAVQVPVKLMIKDGPLVAFIVLLLGLLAAALFGWWNSKGKAASEYVESITKLAEDVQKGKKMQLEERNAATLLLKDALDAIERGESAESVKAKFDAAKAYVTAARAATDTFISANVDPLLDTARDVDPGRTLRERYVRVLSEIKLKLTEGKYVSPDDARQLIKFPPTNLEKEIRAFKTVSDKFGEVPEEKREATRQKMDAAESLKDLRAALQEAGVQVPIPPGVSFDAQADGGASVVPPGLELSWGRQWQLNFGRVAVPLIAFLFVLAVGWVSIYMKTDNFGANPMDYITIFLWGATAEALRGQTITLSSMKGAIKEQPQA